MRFATAALLLLTSASSLAACGARPGSTPEVASAPTAPAQPRRGEGAMPVVEPTAMAAALAAAGLDPKALPPLETLDAKQKLRVMKTFDEALGVACVDCHTEGDFAADTRRKRVAKRMWNEIVRVTALESGDAVYCDSCHRGAMFTLDRRDKAKVSDYMSDVFVGMMKRTDDRDHACETCHGDPPDFKLVSSWKSAPAPDIQLAPALTEPQGESAPAREVR